MKNKSNQSFIDTLYSHPSKLVEKSISQKNKQDVERVLAGGRAKSVDDFAALLSPAASDYLEEMAVLSSQITEKRFGKTIQMYIPLYLSNECINSCSYCGFSRSNEIKRVVLSKERILEEARAIKAKGFDHILLVSGDMGKKGFLYIKEAIKTVRDLFSHISIEVQPLKESEYSELVESGLNTVLVYQETYHENYASFHPAGPKQDFGFRLETGERLGRAGIYKIGLGCLLGLNNWRVDSWYVALHLMYLRKKFWRTRFSISFPRLRPAVGVKNGYQILKDRELVQLICAYRIFDENVELSLSTRESIHFRDHALRLGITAMSAESKTEPGGYCSDEDRQLEQFEIDDDRTALEVAEKISQSGFDPVWKDWEREYCSA